MNLPISTADPIIVAWLAGVLEGEGCFDFTSGTPRIRVKMGDEDVVSRISKLWKCKTHARKDGRSNHSLMYEASVHSESAIRWMRAIFALMSDRRRAKILEILQHYETKNNRLSRAKPKNMGGHSRSARPSSPVSR